MNLSGPSVIDDDDDDDGVDHDHDHMMIIMNIDKRSILIRIFYCFHHTYIIIYIIYISGTGLVCPKEVII
jgi:hypothetical protein